MEDKLIIKKIQLTRQPFEQMSIWTNTTIKYRKIEILN